MSEFGLLRFIGYWCLWCICSFSCPRL